MKYIIIYLVFAFVSQYLIYKWIKNIDKKERKKIQIWEENYINRMIELRKNNNIGDRIEEIKEVEESQNDEDDFLA